MLQSDTFVILVLTLTTEATVGYPSHLYEWIGHPVTWIGRLIARLDRTLNRETWSSNRRRLAGVFALVLLLLATGLVAYAAQALLLTIGLVGLAVSALLASTLLAQRSLHEHVAAVSEGLRERGIEGGREACR